MQERSDFGLLASNGVGVDGPQSWRAPNASEKDGLDPGRGADRSWMNRTALWLALGGLFVPFVSVLLHIAAVVLAVLRLRASRAGLASFRGAAVSALGVSAVALAAYVPITVILLRS